MSPDDQGSLFAEAPAGRGPAAPSIKPAFQPLAARMRPRTLAEVVGQDHLLQPGSLLPRLITTNRFGSLIFYGPPGSALRN